jgi:hypothetical protein
MLLGGWLLLSVPVCLLIGRSLAAAQETLAAADAALLYQGGVAGQGEPAFASTSADVHLAGI